MMQSVNYMTAKQIGNGSLTDQLAAFNKSNGVSSSAPSQPKATAPQSDQSKAMMGAFQSFAKSSQTPYQAFQAVPMQYQAMQDFGGQQTNSRMTQTPQYYQNQQLLQQLQHQYNSIPTSMNYPKVRGR
jgi:hypothetical protein